MKKLREILRDLRDDHDLTQEDVAAYLGIEQQSYSNYENGRRGIPIWVVSMLSRLYQVSTDYLLGADSGYLGNTNLQSPYLDDVTMHDVLYDIQKLDEEARKYLLKYLDYLKHTQK